MNRVTCAGQPCNYLHVLILQHPMYAGAAYGVAMAPGGGAPLPSAGIMPAAYGMPAMYNMPMVCPPRITSFSFFPSASL